MAIRVVYTQPVGNLTEKLVQIDGPNPYTVGGQLYLASAFGLNRILEARVMSSATLATGLPAAALFAYVAPGRQQQGSESVRVVFTTTIAGGTQAGAADLSAQQFYMWVRGY